MEALQSAHSCDGVAAPSFMGTASHTLGKNFLISSLLNISGRMPVGYLPSFCRTFENSTGSVTTTVSPVCVCVSVYGGAEGDRVVPGFCESFPVECQKSRRKGGKGDSAQ